MNAMQDGRTMLMPATASGVIGTVGRKDDLRDGRTADEATAFNVLFCANRGYAQHLAVAAVSLACHSDAPRIRIHVMTCDADAPTEARLAESLRPFPNIELCIHHVTDSRLGAAFVDKYVTKEAYLRLLAADILPDTICRVLYLDCDLVVLDDVTQLADADLGGAPLAAVRDFSWDGQAERLAALGIGPAHPYVNSGVLVLDLEIWRRERLSERLFAEIARFGSRLEYYDQDILNVAFQGRIALLDRRWNLQARIFEPWVRRELPRDHTATRAARRRPGILHYTTEEKPWLFRPRVKKRGLYFQFLARTAWRGSRPPLAGPLQRLEYVLARSLLRVGLDVYEIIPVFRRLSRGRARLASLLAVRTQRGGT